MTCLSIVRLRADGPGDAAMRYRLHQAVEWACAPAPGVKAARALWRWEPNTLLVRSETRPDWRRENPYLDEYTRPQHDGFTVRSDDSPPFTGATCPFRLLANPVRTTQGLRHALPPSEWLPWLTRQGSRCGFSVQRVYATPDMSTPDGRWFVPARGDKHALVLYGVEFAGTLVVTDTGRFASALADGIGHGKAFGYGMLVTGDAGG